MTTHDNDGVEMPSAKLARRAATAIVTVIAYDRATRRNRVPKGNSSRRGLINVALNGLVSAGVIAGFRTNYATKEEPDQLRLLLNATRQSGKSTAAALKAAHLKPVVEPWWGKRSGGLIDLIERRRIRKARRPIGASRPCRSAPNTGHTGRRPWSYLRGRPSPPMQVGCGRRRFLANGPLRVSGGYLNKAPENVVYISDDRPGARAGSQDNCSEP